MHDVVVIGAGLSGLHAALLLEEQGLDVRVLEAQRRVGGRIHSMRQLGSNAEAGGTYIGAGYERVMRVARRFGVRLVDVTPLLKFFREQDLVLDGEIIRQAEWPSHPANPFPRADRALMPWNFHRVVTMRDNPLESPEDWLDPKHAELDVSMRAWMRAQGLSDAAIKIGYELNPSFGDDASDVSALLLLFRAAFTKRQRERAREENVGFTAEHGVDRIPETMAAALRAEVALERRVIAVVQGRDSVHVRCADGTSLPAKRVVCAVPFGVLRRMRLDPPLEGLQAEAVEHLSAQSITQVYLAPRSAFWEADGFAPSLYADSLPGMVAAARSSSDPETITHFTAWIMGTRARELDALEPSAAGRAVIAALEAVRPAARGQVEFLSLHSWGADEFAAGAWAYFKPGQIRRFAAAMPLPHGRVHFCGEHLGVASRGMEAAMESAERAVADVLRHI